MKNRRNFITQSSKAVIALSALNTLGIFSAIGLSACAKTNTKGANMNLTNTAKSNLERYFGKDFSASELAQNDAEFLERYANFAFDEVLSFANLEEKERLMLTLGALIATQGVSEYKNMLNASLNAGVSPVAIKEICYQATPYIGMGKGLDFIITTNEVFKARKIPMPLESRATTTRENRVEKGLEVQRTIFGEAIDKGNASAPNDEKHIRTFLSGHCFGDFYTRGGLDLRFRELLTFVFVSSIGGADAQVKAHAQGNLNMGNDRAKLIATITALIPYIGYPRALNALNAIPKG
ncbi:carboxymuconolactone decarboxylase family protein [Helicobacter sp. T3_23-1056]